jgi:phage tail-like protein
LEAESQVIEYRHGNSKVFSTMKIPGLKKYGNVTLKKGIFNGDSSFWEWYNTIGMNSVKREIVIISLLNEKGNPTMVRTLNNACPAKIQKLI